MTFAFLIMSLILIGSAVGVIAAKSPINSALNLVLNFMVIACMYAMLDAHFLAAVQIVVYAGAIMVLVLFVLMLLNVKAEEPRRGGLFFIGIAAGAGVVFLRILSTTIADSADMIPSAAGAPGTAAAIGEALFSRYVFPFEAASVLIMAAIVGAVMLAKRRYKEV